MARYRTQNMCLIMVHTIGWFLPPICFFVGSSNLKPLSCKEEQVMWIFYEQKIQEVCRAFIFPHKIQLNMASSQRNGIRTPFQDLTNTRNSANWNNKQCIS
ncbi:hypothetical protein VPH35_028660 [Triticum aestivum]